MNIVAASPFDRAEWFALVAAATDERPLIVIAREGENAAALALKVNNGAVTPLSNWYAFTWRPLSNSLGKHLILLKSIADKMKIESHHVTLDLVPDEDGSASLLREAFDQAGWSTSMEECDTNHILRVSGRDYAEYLATRPGRLRTTLARKAKKVDTQIIGQFDPDLWAQYEEIYAQSWKPAEGDPALLRAFAEAEGAAGRLRLGIALMEGEAVAAQFWTVESGCAFIHKLAHLEEHKKLSAGSTLTAALFRHVIDEDKVEMVDFGTGDDSYKADWMEETRPRYRIECLNSANPRSWPTLGQVKAKRLIRRLAPVNRPR